MVWVTPDKLLRWYAMKQRMERLWGRRTAAEDTQTKAKERDTRVVPTPTPPKPQVQQRTPVDEATGSGLTPQPTARQNTAPPAGSTTQIGQQITINGELTGEGDVEIGGTVKGSIVLVDYKATISKAGKAFASIEAKSVEVLGEVNGNITARELVTIRSGSTVVGDIVSLRVNLEDGAHFKGTIEMRPQVDVPKKPTSPDPKQRAPRPSAAPQVSKTPASS